MKLKLKDSGLSNAPMQAAPAAAGKQASTFAPTRRAGSPPAPTEPHRADAVRARKAAKLDAARKAPKAAPPRPRLAPLAAPAAPEASPYTVTTTLQGRHHEWLAAIAKMEGRTIPQMLERLVRIGYSQDHGKVRNTGATQPGGAGQHAAERPCAGASPPLPCWSMPCAMPVPIRK